MKKYISVSRVSETLMLLQALKRYSCYDIMSLRHLKITYGINKQAALDFAVQCNWVELHETKIDFTDQGDNLQNKFGGFSLSQEIWLDVLYSYIVNCRPSWASLIPQGRKEAFIFMSTDEKRCFVEAGLMNDITGSVVCWWDNIANLFRNKSDDNKNALGRKGEKLTLRYEKHRTLRDPFWQSIDSNRVGYDIISVLNQETNTSLYIEVKSSEKDMSHASMHITRNEWQVAMGKSKTKNYLFYLWLLSEQNKLAVLTIDDVSCHMPNNMGDGKWESVEIPFSSFCEKFKTVYLDD